MVNLPEKIKQLRKKNGWTVKGLASKCGVSPRTVENWEQGRTSLSGPSLLIIKKLLSESD